MHLSVIVFAAVLAYAYGESCVSTRNCDHEVCDRGYHVVCAKRVCTCASGSAPTTDAPGVKCDSSRACSSSRFPSCRAEYTHCVDNLCKCLPNLPPVSS